MTITAEAPTTWTPGDPLRHPSGNSARRAIIEFVEDGTYSYEPDEYNSREFWLTHYQAPWERKGMRWFADQANWCGPWRWLRGDL